MLFLKSQFATLLLISLVLSVESTSIVQKCVGIDDPYLNAMIVLDDSHKLNLYELNQNTRTFSATPWLEFDMTTVSSNYSLWRLYCQKFRGQFIVTLCDIDNCHVRRAKHQTEVYQLPEIYEKHLDSSTWSLSASPTNEPSLILSYSFLSPKPDILTNIGVLKPEIKLSRNYLESAGNTRIYETDGPVQQLMNFALTINSASGSETHTYGYIVRSSHMNVPRGRNSKLEWVTAVGRLCLKDTTQELHSWMEVLLNCGADVTYLRATRATIQRTQLYLYCEPDGSTNSLEHRIVRYDFTNGMHAQFDRMWSVCQAAPSDSNDQCKAYNAKHDYCPIVSREGHRTCASYGEFKVQSDDPCKLPVGKFLQELGYLLNTTVTTGDVVAKFIHPKPEAQFRSIWGQAVDLVVDENGTTAHVLYNDGHWSRIELDKTDAIEESKSPAIDRRPALGDKHVLMRGGLAFWKENKWNFEPLKTCKDLYQSATQLIKAAGHEPLDCVWCLRDNQSIPWKECNGAFLRTKKQPTVNSFTVDNKLVNVWGDNFDSFEATTLTVQICQRNCLLDSATKTRLTCTTDLKKLTSGCYANVTGQLEGRMYTINRRKADASTEMPYGAKNTIHVLVAILVVAVVIVTLCIVLVIWRHRRGQHKHQRMNSGSTPIIDDMPHQQIMELGQRHNSQRGNNRYERQPNAVAMSLNTSTEYEDLRFLVPEAIQIPLEQIRFDTQIGEGHFGVVLKATIMAGEHEGQKVAVKTLRAGMRGYREFLQEGLRMENFNHPRVMKLIGITFTEQLQPMIITTFMPKGDLLSYLNCASNTPTLHQLLEFGVEVAEGMQYLSKLRFVHRDLAARNCMLDEALHIKIADFGLCRDVYESNDVYEARTTDRDLPIRWMAPESIGSLDFTSKGDVWAFGVVMWELMTRGAMPYKGVHGPYLLGHLQAGNRLPKPPYCPDMIYTDVMERCWKWEPNERPTFHDLCLTLPAIIRHLLGLVRHEMESPYERVDTMVRHSAPANA